MKLRFASLFSGAGGLDIGLEEAGWECAYASDIDPAAVETLRLNRNYPISCGVLAFEKTYIEQADVRNLSAACILGKAGVRKGDLQLLAGGPPCQSWSSAGHQKGFDDPRGVLFRDFVRIASDLDVRWLVFENVRGLLTARGPDGEPGSALALIRETLLEAGFQTSVALLNAADYGVPQRRVRIVITGFREGDAPALPVATHTKTFDLHTRDKQPWISLRAAISQVGTLSESELIYPNNRLLAALSSIPPGSGVKSPGKRETTRPGGHWGYKQGAFVADLDQSARTVTASSQQDWIKDPIHGLRRLCPRECAAIQTFPLGWKFHGTATAQYRQIGNAVPPRLAKAVGLSLKEHASNAGENSRPIMKLLMPLPKHLDAAVAYTKREERSNGGSRLNAPSKKRVRMKFESFQTNA